jgi:hypothetical protein
MDDFYGCKVKNPYVAQNKDFLEVHPSKLFGSYMNTLSIKMEKIH